MRKRELLLAFLVTVLAGLMVLGSETTWHQLGVIEEQGADPYVAWYEQSGTLWAKLLLNETGTTFDFTTNYAGVGMVFDAADAAAGTANTYYDFTGALPAHTTGTLTDYLVKLTPTIGIATAATTTQYMFYESFTTPVWTTGTHTLVGMQISPTIGNATGGTNTFTAFAIGNITGDAQVTETAFSIGTGYDTGFTCGSPVTFTGGLSLSGGVINLNASSNYAVNICTGTSTGAVSIGGTAGNTIAVGTDDTVADDIDIGSDKDDVDIEGEDITLDTADDGDVTVADDWTFTMESAGGIFAVGGTAGSVFNLYVDDTTADTIQIGSAKDNVDVDGEDVQIESADDLHILVASTDSILNIGTGAYATDLNIGNATGATDVDITAGTGGVTLASTSTGDVTLDSSDDVIFAVADDVDFQIESSGGIFDANGTLGAVYTVATDDSVADDVDIGSAKDDVDIEGEDITLTTADDMDLTSTSAGGIIALGGTPGLVFNIAADDTTADDVNLGSAKDDVDIVGATVDITSTDIVLEGATKTNSLTIDDGSEDVKIDSDNQTATLPTITIPDFTDATADFLVTNTFTTVLPFHGGLAGEDTDAVGTNGAGLVGGGAIDVTTYDYNDGAAGANDVLVKVYDHGTTTWDDLKTAALLTAGADWAINYQLLPDADAEAENDCFAIGFDEKFCEFAFNDLATDAGALATWGGDGAKWQYSTGAGTWSDLTVYDGTDATAQDGKRPLQRAGAISFVPPADWVVATYDSEEAYWIRSVITVAQLTQTPVIDTTNHDEPIIPFPTDGLPAPFKLEITKVRVANMHATVHDQAIVFIVGNFTDGTFSAAQTWAASQLCDTFTLASAIAADPGDVIGILCTNDTASTNNPIWAVELTVTYED